MFREEAKKYNKNVLEAPCPPKTTKQSQIQLDIFGGQCENWTIETKIKQYLTESLQDEDVDILQYWSGRSAMYVSLSSMAQSFLSIPATSAPTERVFLKSKVIVGPQQASLDAESIEQLMCVKEWYRFFGTLAADDEAKEIL